MKQKRAMRREWKEEKDGRERVNERGKGEERGKEGKEEKIEKNIGKTDRGGMREKIGKRYEGKDREEEKGKEWGVFFSKRIRKTEGKRVRRKCEEERGIEYEIMGERRCSLGRGGGRGKKQMERKRGKGQVFKERRREWEEKKGL